MKCGFNTYKVMGIRHYFIFVVIDDALFKISRISEEFIKCFLNNFKCFMEKSFHYLLFGATPGYGQGLLLDLYPEITLVEF